ncbi:MAG: PAS domain S-box protein [Scytonema sp. PMC 1069.18]|nr:PAS domain S-box protein [Scytonema sp. PMC 1069.18]MEC4888032.1 PAS domain S-box protein [Scytonema sp. PMC 1070.18]
MRCYRTKAEGREQRIEGGKSKKVNNGSVVFMLILWLERLLSRILGFLQCDRRKQAELALQESVEKLQLFIKYAPACIVMFDRQMRYIAASQQWINEFHVNSSIESITGRSHYELFPNLPEHLKQSYQRGLAGSIEKCDEDLFVHLDGSQQWFQWEVHPWYCNNGNIGGIILFYKDITKRKQAEIALQQLNAELEQRVAERTAQLTQLNEHLRAALMEQNHARQLLEDQAQLLDLAHDTIITRDLNGVISFWNEGAEHTYGWKNYEAIGQNTHMLMKTQFPKPFAEIEAELLEKGYWEGELIHFSREARPLTVASRWVLQKDNAGQPIKILEINNDITKRKQAEDALRQSEEKFRQLAENIQAVFWITEIQNQQVLYVSPAYETIWQRSRESLYQKSLSWLDVIHPDDRQRVENTIVEQQKTGQSDIEYRIIRPDGSICWIRDRAFSIRNELGEVIRIAGIAEDITEKHKIEQMKSEFISVVSHELRTPLAAIRASLGLLNSGLYDEKPDKFKRMIEIATIDSDRLVRLVNDILDLERLESGQAILEKTICNAADLIQQAVEGVLAIAKQQNITFDIRPTNAKVWAEADAIIQTLTNILGNALKFSPSNSIITVRVQQQTDNVRFEIEDRGRGIPPEKLEAIFGRFEQVDASDSRSKGGTGLGLAICRSIINQHGGQIWAESTVGVGSTFFFTLPVSPKDYQRRYNEY